MKNEVKGNARVRYYIDSKSIWGQGAVMLMLIAAVFRIIGCWGLWSDASFAWTQIVLPIACNILFALCVCLFGKKGFLVSALPVLLGVVFFIIKSLTFDSKIHMVLCILLYLVVAVLYTGTVTGSIGTKWLLPPLFGLPFIYHVFVEDLPALSNTAQPVTFSAGMQEMSVLCIMAALFCTGMGLKKRQPAEPELPKIADPIVIPPQSEPAAEVPQAPAEEAAAVEPAEQEQPEAAPETETGDAQENNNEA